MGSTFHNAAVYLPHAVPCGMVITQHGPSPAPPALLPGPWLFSAICDIWGLWHFSACLCVFCHELRGGQVHLCSPPLCRPTMGPRPLHLTIKLGKTPFLQMLLVIQHRLPSSSRVPFTFVWASVSLHFDSMVVWLSHAPSPSSLRAALQMLSLLRGVRGKLFHHLHGQGGLSTIHGHLWRDPSTLLWVRLVCHLM